MSKKRKRNIDNSQAKSKEFPTIVAKDTYSNIPANLGLGSSNLTQTARYVMTRFTWDYWTLNVLYRNNWIAKAIIDKPANEMMKNGFEIQSQIDPEQAEKIMQIWNRTKTNEKFLKLIKWSRLFGGCLLIPMIADQPNMEEPLDFDTIMPDSYKGCFLVDRWSGVNPSVEVITDIDDPDFGLPEYYDISANQLSNTIRVHHSRVIKMIGRPLPYWEEIAEDWWGASELEHIFEELKKRDDTSANISFLIFLSNIRIYKMRSLGQMLTMGDQEAAQVVYNTMVNMNRLMCNTGTMVMDQEDGFEQHELTNLAGINDIYESFMLDISGAAEIPVDKLFGRSPAGFNNGEETLQNYYDSIQEKQESDIRPQLEKLLRIITMSALGSIPDDFEISFNPVRRPADMEKADLAYKLWQPISEALAQNVITKDVALRELKHQTPLTGLWTNITDEMIEKAQKEVEESDVEDAELENKLTDYINKMGDNNGKNMEGNKQTDE